MTRIRAAVPRTELVHITAAFACLAWGLEAVLPWTVWRLCLAVYLFYWVGLHYLATIGLHGIYVMNTASEEE